jgi:hypothetical protein
MAPLVESFHPRHLEERIQYTTDGKKRKQPVELKECELKEMIQYSCELDGPTGDPKSKVVCQPFLRLFRK